MCVRAQLIGELSFRFDLLFIVQLAIEAGIILIQSDACGSGIFSLRARGGLIIHFDFFPHNDLFIQLLERSIHHQFSSYSLETFIF
jgi:hypothetical protein